MNRRSFLKISTLGAGAAIITTKLSTPVKAATAASLTTPLKLTYEPYTLKLKHTFTLSTTSRTTTPAMLTRLEYEGYTGYGEASMPPYLGESQDSVASFLAKVNLSSFKDPLQAEDILNYIDDIEPGNYAAKAAIDIALHDLIGKLLGRPLYNIWGYDKDKAPYTSYTIGIDTPDMIEQKVREVSGFKIFKLKLGRGTDKDIVRALRRVTDVAFTADANQGWTDRQQALDTIFWLKEEGCQLIEQPLAKERIDDIAWISERSPIPVLADEGFQRLDELKNIVGAYSGIVVKLMKCTGLREAQKMLNAAKALGMKTLIGCMTETSCGISAASQLSMLADWADLDGNLLISNDPFQGTQVVKGKLTLNDLSGIGASRLTST